MFISVRLMLFPMLAVSTIKTYCPVNPQAFVTSCIDSGKCRMSRTETTTVQQFLQYYDLSRDSTEKPTKQQLQMTNEVIAALKRFDSGELMESIFASSNTIVKRGLERSCFDIETGPRNPENLDAHQVSGRLEDLKFEQAMNERHRKELVVKTAFYSFLILSLSGIAVSSYKFHANKQTANAFEAETGQLCQLVPQCASDYLLQDYFTAPVRMYCRCDAKNLLGGCVRGVKCTRDVKFPIENVDLVTGAIRTSAMQEGVDKNKCRVVNNGKGTLEECPKRPGILSQRRFNQNIMILPIVLSIVAFIVAACVGNA